MIDGFWGDAFGVLSCPFWSTVLQCGDRQPIHTLNYCMDRVVSGAIVSFLGVHLCVTLHILDLWRYYVCCTRSRLSVIRCCALIAHLFTYAPPRCRTSQNRKTFIPLSVSLWNDLSDHIFDGMGQAGFKSRDNAFL